MPLPSSPNPGRAGENTLSARLADLLRERGFADADFERQFTITDSVTGRHVLRKPDVVFSNGGTHIVSAKVGERRERETLSTAISYLRDLSPVTNLGVVFAVTYPEGEEPFHFHVLPAGSVEEISVVLESLDQVADAINEVVRGRIQDILARQEPVHVEAGRLLKYTAQDLSVGLLQAPSADLEEIFGGHDFFHSALSAGLTGEERDNALRLGPAYLFVNQVLFYTLLSQAAKAKGRPKLFPEIESADRGSPTALQAKYFDLVRQKDYEPIYGSDIARHLDVSKVGYAVDQLVDTLSRLAPKLTVPDLVGQVFQNLIPFGVRKPLGAYFTNPNAARLLASLAIESAHSTVLDPACGSGTLLVASYRRKWALLGKTESSRPQETHKAFVGNELTGIDAMAFSSHLAAVNLALQEPLLDTDYVRIARADSTSLMPGHTVVPVGESLPGDFRQQTLFDSSDRRKTSTKRSRIPTLRQGRSSSFVLDPVDVVIMNPPFTSQNNMSPEYRAKLKLRFRTPSAYRKIVFWKTSEQVFFLLIADRFLKDDGRLAAVLPLTTFTGRAFQPLVRYLVENYVIEVIVAGLGRSSFSEDTSLTECLIVARKRKPETESTFKFVTVDLSPDRWSSADVDRVLGMIEKGGDISGIGRTKSIAQTELLPGRSTLSGLLLRSIPDFDRAWTAFEYVAQHSRPGLIPVGQLFDRGLEITEVYHGDNRPLRLGPRALIACRTGERAIKATDRLVLHSEVGGITEVRDRLDSNIQFRFPSSSLAPCLRRFSFLSTMDITGQTDFIAAEVNRTLENAMRAFYTESESKKFLKALSTIGWSSIIERGSSRVNISARANLAAPGTIFLAFRSDDPTFLAGAYGYTVKGFDSEREEKLFTLWFNSTVALTQLIAKATITEGPWVKLEQFTTEQVLMPDPQALSEPQWKQVERLWAKVSQASATSLFDQLKGSALRQELDRSLLAIIGLDSQKSSECASRLADGTRAAIEMLVKTLT
jgi:hypothetical protein